MLQINDLSTEEIEDLGAIGVVVTEAAEGPDLDLSEDLSRLGLDDLTVIIAAELLKAED